MPGEIGPTFFMMVFVSILSLEISGILSLTPLDHIAPLSHGRENITACRWVGLLEEAENEEWMATE